VLQCVEVGEENSKPHVVPGLLVKGNERAAVWYVMVPDLGLHAAMHMNDYAPSDRVTMTRSEGPKRKKDARREFGSSRVEGSDNRRGSANGSGVTSLQGDVAQHSQTKVEGTSRPDAGTGLGSHCPAPQQLGLGA
jgi:hypothetical protein